MNGGRATALAEELAAIVGSAHVLADDAARTLASHDLYVWPGRVTPDLVIRPASTAEAAAVLAIAARHRLAVVPRGGGLSYTAGVVPHQHCIVLDVTRMDAIDVREDDLTVVVGAGCTWEKLGTALQARGLRTVLSGPISGSHSTVGGAMSQNLPGSMDGLVGLTVVLADGEIVRTGSWGLERSEPFWRSHGPDLTGLFQGDCGAFGIKTEVALRLERMKPSTAISVAFERADDLLVAFVELLRRGLVTGRAFAIDRARTDVARASGAAEALKTVASVARNAASIGQAVRDVAGLVRSQGDLAAAAWTFHITVESLTDAGVAAQAEAVRAVVLRRGHEIEPAVPNAMRARPFSLRGFLGPGGERWVPVHGIVALSRARDCFAAIEDYLNARATELTSAGIRTACLISSTGAYMLFEPMLYWPDALGPLQRAYLSPRDQERFGKFSENAPARGLVTELRMGLRDVMDAAGAVHVQLGRFYALPDASIPGTRHVLDGIKKLLDPDERMNPGVLGLPSR